MISKFEKLEDQLFNEQINENEMSKLTGGECYNPSTVSVNTYVLQNGDHRTGEDCGYMENIKWDSDVQEGWLN